MTSPAQGGQTGPRALSTQHGDNGIRGKQILYVDDDPLMRQAERRLFRRAGTICLLASTHDQAVAVVAAEPELVLAILDFHMPDGPVGQLVRRLRIVRPVLPLIGISGSERRSEFARHGVTQFFEKPLMPDDLARAVDLISASTPRARPEISTKLRIPAQFLHE